MQPKRYRAEGCGTHIDIALCRKTPQSAVLTYLHVCDSREFFFLRFFSHRFGGGSRHAVSQVTPACFPTLQKCVLTSRFASKLCLDKGGESEPKGTDCSCVGLENWVFVCNLTVQSFAFNHSCLVAMMMMQTDYKKGGNGPSKTACLIVDG